MATGIALRSKPLRPPELGTIDLRIGFDGLVSDTSKDV